MKYSDSSSIFGVEKEESKLNEILLTIYQSLEEKAANLIYFLIKDHPFSDVYKRIAATIFS